MCSVKLPSAKYVLQLFKHEVCGVQYNFYNGLLLEIGLDQIFLRHSAVGVSER